MEVFGTELMVNFVQRLILENVLVIALATTVYVLLRRHRIWVKTHWPRRTLNWLAIACVVVGLAVFAIAWNAYPGPHELHWLMYGTPSSLACLAFLFLTLRSIADEPAIVLGLGGVNLGLSLGILWLMRGTSA